MKKLYNWMQQQSKYENAAYTVLWGLLFAAPVLSLYIRAASDSNLTFEWQEVLMVWKLIAIYLCLFLIHNFILAPMLVWQHRRIHYFVLTGCLLAGFIFYQCSNHPKELGPKPMTMEERGKMHHMEGKEDMEFQDEPPGQPPMEPPMGDMRPEKPEGFNEGHHPDRMPFKNPRMKGHDGPPAFVGEHDIVAIVILILMFGVNLGIKGYFKSRRDQKKLIALEKKNLEQQLEYLKYQINPHFFMNTLNNIHALVDIDPEKAKDTILELSKMMRFVLYEGDKRGVPLNREFDFIRNYVTLMRLRYTDKVKISVDLPTETPDKLVPPLMLITFIENAFKHGISYQHESFIDVKVGIEHERLRFQCRNSKADKPNQEKGGVGLANVKQRLHLLYDNNFTLNIQDEPDIYNVELTIPLA